MLVLPHLVSELANHFTLLKLVLAQQNRLAPHQLVAIGLLSANGSMRFKELRSRLSLPKSSFTFLVDGLEGRGLVERTREEEDRRQWKVALTSRGRSLAASIDRNQAAVIEPVLAPLSEQAGEALLSAIDRFPGAEGDWSAIRKGSRSMKGSAARLNRRGG